MRMLTGLVAMAVTSVGGSSGAEEVQTVKVALWEEISVKDFLVMLKLSVWVIWWGSVSL